MSPLEGLLTLYFSVLGLAVLCDAITKTRFTGTVASAPFRLIIWAGRGILQTIGDLLHDVARAAGRGIARAMEAVHRYFYRRWPGVTVIIYIAISTTILLWLIL